MLKLQNNDERHYPLHPRKQYERGGRGEKSSYIKVLRHEKLR